MNSLHACGQSKDAKSTLYGKGRLSICWKYHGIVNIHYFGKFTKVQGLTFINAGMKTWLKKKKQAWLFSAHQMWILSINEKFKLPKLNSRKIIDVEKLNVY